MLELTPTADTVITKRWSSIRAFLWCVFDTKLRSSWRRRTETQSFHRTRLFRVDPPGGLRGRRLAACGPNPLSWCVKPAHAASRPERVAERAGPGGRGTFCESPIAKTLCRSRHARNRSPAVERHRFPRSRANDGKTLVSVDLAEIEHKPLPGRSSGGDHAVIALSRRGSKRLRPSWSGCNPPRAVTGRTSSANATGPTD